MYFIVDKIIFLLSAKFMVGWPYRYRCDWFPKWFRLYFCKICITLLAKVALWGANKGHKNKKWLVSSIPWLQRHISEGVSMKLWDFLWYFKKLKPTLNCRRYRSPKGSCIPKMFFFSCLVCLVSCKSYRRSSLVDTMRVVLWLIYPFVEFPLNADKIFCH